MAHYRYLIGAGLDCDGQPVAADVQALQPLTSASGGQR